MTKRLVVQVPCFNEEDSIGAVIAEIPRAFDRIDEVIVLVVDDGSTDDTAAVALANGADYVVRHAGNRGLAAAFRTGLDAAIRLGADIVVNTDGDNQYRGADISRLIEPIVQARADLVVGDRQPATVEHFSLIKRALQALGSQVVRWLSGASVPDAPSGFRALSREAAMRLNVITSYSYTLETVIQAGSQRMSVTSVPISPRPTPRQSRLSRGSVDYVRRSMGTIVRAYAMYRPLRVFLLLSSILLLPGLIGVIRFIWFYFGGSGSGHVQSLILSAVLMIVGFQVGLIGLVADLIAANRRLAEEALYRLRRIDMGDDAGNIQPNEHGSRGDRDFTEPRSRTHV